MPSSPAAGRAYLFPGQGSQSVGMGRNLYESEPAARALWDQADAELGFALTRVAFEGPESVLQRTENAQPALLVASVATLEVLRLHGRLEDAGWVAGHSLGEYSALVAAESLSFLDAVRLVRRRGKLMAQARNGAMVAVIGLDSEAIEKICADSGAEVANYNSPDQTVISGTVAAVEQATESCRVAGARRIVPLSVSGAFHSSLMRPASAAFEAAVSAVPLGSPRLTVIGNLRAEPLASVEEIRRELAEQLYSPVRWVDTLRALSRAGVSKYIEVGPGRVLTGLVRRTLPEATALASDVLLSVAA